MKASLGARAASRSRITVDWLRGLDFQKFVSREELGYDPEVCYDYAPSGDRFLKAVLKDLHVTGDDAILDIGCGKGSAMRLMLKFPFSKVAGVELSPRLGAIATRNFELLRAERSEVFVGDATQLDRYGEFNVFYFYNPFSAVVMSKVLTSVTDSYRHSDKEVVLIYNNPTCHQMFIEAGLNKVRDYPDEWGNEIFVYSNKPPECSRLAG